mmetsp:Transcript_13019/g.37939  ORF Transcript_13019/g.37939 Transcript_13019/m.37939 type:complete len:221 (+) Transcript_13019:559-1221(+)
MEHPQVGGNDQPFEVAGENGTSQDLQEGRLALPCRSDDAVEATLLNLQPVVEGDGLLPHQEANVQFVDNDGQGVHRHGEIGTLLLEHQLTALLLKVVVHSLALVDIDVEVQQPCDPRQRGDDLLYLQPCLVNILANVANRLEDLDVRQKHPEGHVALDDQEAAQEGEAGGRQCCQPDCVVSVVCEHILCVNTCSVTGFDQMLILFNEVRPLVVVCNDWIV